MALSRRDTQHQGYDTGLTDRASAIEAAEAIVCDSCGATIEGEPAARGLFLWTRGDEVRYEEPPLCGACAETPVFFEDDFFDGE